MPVLLYVTVALIAACGLIYELVAGTLASYLLGDSVLQFSTVIGSYLFAMGIGSWLSRFITRGLAPRFVQIELMVAVVGGFSSAALFLAFAYTQGFRFLLYVVVVIVGILVGLEIPLLMRILKDRVQFRDLVAHVLTFDYLGALGASLLFPILLVPRLGMVRAALLFGIVNAGGRAVVHVAFRRGAPEPGAPAPRLRRGARAAGGRHGGRRPHLRLRRRQPLRRRGNPGPQHALPAHRADALEGRPPPLPQLGTCSSARATSTATTRRWCIRGWRRLPGARRALVLGGGDGLALREMLKYPSLESITLVDLDPDMTGLFATHPLLTKLNGGSLTHPKVRVINADAFPWLDSNTDMFDFVVIDFPDPTNYSLGKLYTTAFYRLLARHLSRHGLVVVQSTSPMFARQSYWCIVETIKQAGLRTHPYHAYVPSFGEWGFILAGPGPTNRPRACRTGCDSSPCGNLPALFEFPNDMQPVPAEPNRLNDQVLVRYYERDWSALGH